MIKLTRTTGKIKISGKTTEVTDVVTLTLNDFVADKGTIKRILRKYNRCSACVSDSCTKISFVCFGKSKCSESDVYDEKTGISIAGRRSWMKAKNKASKILTDIVAMQFNKAKEIITKSVMLNEPF